MSKGIISNLPYNRLYRFDEYYYVWKIKLHSTREGNYSTGELADTIEVYEIYNNMIHRVASGRLVSEEVTAKVNDFTIFDYDQDNSYTFGISKPIKEASATEYRLLKDNIALTYNKNNKK